MQDSDDDALNDYLSSLKEESEDDYSEDDDEEEDEEMEDEEDNEEKEPKRSTSPKFIPSKKEIYLETFKEFNNSTNSQSEPDVIREILNMLRGIANTMFIRNESLHQFELVAEFSGQAVLCKWFIQLANKILHMKENKALEMMASKSNIYEVFYHTLRHTILDDWNLVKYESFTSLFKLYKEFVAYNSRVSFLYKLVLTIETWIGPSVEAMSRERLVESVGKLMNLLYNVLTDLQQCNDSKYEMVFTLFQSSFDRFNVMLQEWIVEGTLHSDVCNEFFIASNNAVQLSESGSDHYWTDAFQLRSNDVPVFLRSLTDDIMLIGKSLNLIRCIQNTTGVEEDQVPKQETRKTNALFQPNTAASNKHSKYKVLKKLSKSPLSPQTSSEVQELIRTKINAVILQEQKSCYRLVQLIVGKGKLLEHLCCMKSIYLMGMGDVMKAFCNQLFDLAHNGKSELDSLELNTAMQECFSMCRDFPRLYSDAYPFNIYPLLNRFTFASEHALSISDTSIKMFKDLKLKYVIDWPLNIVVQEKDMQVYNEMFIFLLMIKRGQYLLSGIHFDQFKHGILKQINQRIYLLIFQMKQFVNTLENYVMTRLDFDELLEQVQHSKDLDQILLYHASFLSKLQDKCLLRKANYVYNKILEVLNLCVNLRLICDEFYNAFVTHRDKYEDKELQLNEDEVEILETEEDYGIRWYEKQTMTKLQTVSTQFANNVNMLVVLIHKILKRGIHPHLEDLEIRLNFNKFYQT